MANNDHTYTGAPSTAANNDQTYAHTPSVVVNKGHTYTHFKVHIPVEDCMCTHCFRQFMLACVPWFHLHTTIYTRFNLHTTTHTRFHLHTTMQTRFHLLIRWTIHANRGFLAANHLSTLANQNITIFCVKIAKTSICILPHKLKHSNRAKDVGSEQNFWSTIVDDARYQLQSKMQTALIWNRLKMKQLGIPVHKVPLSGQIKSLWGQRQGLKAQHGILYMHRLIITLPHGSLLKNTCKSGSNFRVKLDVSKYSHFLLCELWSHSKSILNTQYSFVLHSHYPQRFQSVS